MEPTIINYILLILMLALSFFFSGMEIAFLSASLLKIELKQRQGSRAARILSYFKKRTSEVLITILIGNNLALVLFTLQIDKLSGPILENQFLLDPEVDYAIYTILQTLTATLIILIFAEYIPKAIFRRNSDRIIFPASFILSFFFWLFRVPVLVVNGIAKFILRYLFRVTTDDKIVELGKKDLDQYIHEIIAASDQEPVPDLDTDMLTNALAFKETKARECMIPRTEIIAMPGDTSMDKLMDLFIETNLSKIIIYKENLDDIAGFVHSNAMFSSPQSIGEVLQPVLIIPETMPANVLLAEFTENKRTVAIVVDEFGGTAGIVTMEDLVEEVFGEIEDEHDAEDEEVDEDMIKIVQDDGSVILGARWEIDDLNESELELNLPEEEYYTTLGGLITYHAEKIPKKGEIIDIGFYRFHIIKATNNRIITVKLEKIEEE